MILGQSSFYIVIPLFAIVLGDGVQTTAEVFLEGRWEKNIVGTAFSFCLYFTCSSSFFSIRCSLDKLGVSEKPLKLGTKVKTDLCELLMWLLWSRRIIASKFIFCFHKRVFEGFSFFVRDDMKFSPLN